MSSLEKAFDRLDKLITEQRGRETVTPLPNDSADQSDEALPLPSEPGQETDQYIEPTEPFEIPPDQIYQNNSSLEERH
jgi:hypothetical protein